MKGVSRYTVNDKKSSRSSNITENDKTKYIPTYSLPFSALLSLTYSLSSKV
jgi:hypothetical protein